MTEPHQYPQPDAGMTAMLDREGFEWSWEYPGILVITVGRGLYVNTALHGYEYGSSYDAVAEREGSVNPDTAAPEDWLVHLRILRDAVGG